MKKLFFFCAGIVLVALGVIGLILPIVPGWPLLFLGLVFLAPRVAYRMQNSFERSLFKHETVYFPEWKKFGADAGITTRRFPVVLKKTGELDSDENRKSFRSQLSQSPSLLKNKVVLADKIIYLNQVHGNAIAVLDAPEKMPAGGFMNAGEADGALTNQPQTALLIFTADCLSIFFCVVPKKDNPKASWVGAVHAGWRGTEKKIAEGMAEALKKASGCGGTEIHAIFGPCIGPRHYEVGEEFRKFFSAPSLTEKNGKLYFDLLGENKRQLLSSGIPEENISLHSMCTVEENKNFYSFRKEKDAAGRMISFIQLR